MVLRQGLTPATANRMATRFKPVPDPVEHIANADAGRLQAAGAEVVTNDPTANEFGGFLDGWEQAKDPMHRLRHAISAETQQSSRRAHQAPRFR
jgi:hypothetical protein